MHICLLTFGSETLSWPVFSDKKLLSQKATVTAGATPKTEQGDRIVAGRGLSQPAWGNAGKFALLSPLFYLFSG